MPSRPCEPIRSGKTQPWLDKIGKIYADGGVGKCDSCHTRHIFNKLEASQPEACETCHLGLDHEQIEYYKKSKHGMIQETNRMSSRAPACITCHMDGGTHDVSQVITIGMPENIFQK